MDWEKLKTTYTDAAAISSAEARSAFLDAACADQPELRARVESLLNAREKLGGFLEAPLLEPQNA